MPPSPASAGSQHPQSGPQTIIQQTNSESQKQDSEDAQAPGRTRRRRRKDRSSAEPTVTRLLVCVKALLESLTEWSKGNLPEVGVSDVYVRMGSELYAVVALFREVSVDTSQMASAFSSLRPVLEALLGEEATSENLDKHLPHVRSLIHELLQALRKDQFEYRKKASSSSGNPPHTSLDDTTQPKRSDTHTGENEHVGSGAPGATSPSKGQSSEVVAREYKVSRPQKDSRQEASTRGTRPTRLSGASGRSKEGSVPVPAVQTAVTRLLASTKELLESLTKWSRRELTESDVSDIYVRMGNDFNAALVAFQDCDIDISDLISIPGDLREVLEQALVEEATPENLEIYLPDIRAIIKNLLQGLRVKQDDYKSKVSGLSKSSSRKLEERSSPRPSDKGNQLGPKNVSAVPALGSSSENSLGTSDEHAATRSQAEHESQPASQLAGGSAPASPVSHSVTRLLVSIKRLLKVLTRWSKMEATESDVRDVCVRIGNEFNFMVAVFEASGIDMSDLVSVPDDLRAVVEQGLAEEATAENLETYLPEVRAIVTRLLQGLRVKEAAYKARNSAPSGVSSRRLEERSIPRPPDATNQLGSGGGTTATLPGSSSDPIRGEGSSVNAAPALSSLSKHLARNPGASDERTDTRLEVERGSSPASQPPYKSDDASAGNRHSHTQPDETLPSVGPSSVTPNESKITGEIVITRNMSIAEIMEHLCRHGCNDVSGQLDTSKSSEYPVSSGGYGDVYRGAFHDGNSVAIKCLRLPLDEAGIPQKQLRATQEIYVWSRCIHPNILGLTGVARYRNQLAMVSPWMPYGNLRRLLSREPGVDRYNLCTQIVDGIAYLHEAGVVHGDLKGDNILFSEDLTPKLTDFGNATLKEYTLQFSRTTSRAGMSLNWVAPEVLKEETGPTPEADIWSLGMTMLEVMTGEPPYAGILKFGVMRRIESRILPVRPEAHLPSRKMYADLIWLLFKDCWAYEPLQRPRAVEVQDRMKGVISERDLEGLNSGVQQQL